MHPSGENRCWEALLATSSGIEDVTRLIVCRHPVNVIGSEAALQTLGWGPSVRAHGCELHGIHPAAFVAETLDRGGGLDGLVRQLTAKLVPRSSTVVLDPGLARMLVVNPEPLERLSLHTAGCVLMPLEIASAPYKVVYSDVFSFPEHDPAGISHWVWTERPGRAFCTIAHEGGAGEYDIAFTLTAANPGSFTVRLGESELHHTATAGNLSRRFDLLCHLVTGANTLEIDFDGPSTRPGGSHDQRAEIVFCIGDLLVSDAQPTSQPAVDSRRPSCLTDEALRRLAHAAGFFEVDTVACSRFELAWQVGLRSCFDYRQEFRFRDYRRFLVPPDRPTETPADVPRCLWYRFAKTPHPGSEWSGYVPPTSFNAAILHEKPLNHAPDDILAVYETHLTEVRLLLEERTALLEESNRAIEHRGAELTTLREVLAERTGLLEKSNLALEARSKELGDIRESLEERTGLLEKSNQALEHQSKEVTMLRELLAERTGLLEKSNLALVARSKELVAIRESLEERTGLLEKSYHALERRSDELVTIRELLVERTRSLEKSIMTLTEQLVTARNLLTERTTALERAVQDSDATARSLVELKTMIDEIRHGPICGPPLFLTRRHLRAVTQSLEQIRNRLNTLAHNYLRSQSQSP